jgi:hypothetical protein
MMKAQYGGYHFNDQCSHLCSDFGNVCMAAPRVSIAAWCLVRALPSRQVCVVFTTLSVVFTVVSRTAPMTLCAGHG